MAYRIGFLDRDMGYGKALMEYINTQAKASLEMSVFTDAKRLEEYMRVKPISLLLVGDDCPAVPADCPVVFLTAKKEQQGAIYRYQSARLILEQLLERLAGAFVCAGTDSVFLAVYSPVGRCGKSLFARALASELGKCVLVSWEGFSGEEGELGSRFLYLLKSRNEEVDEIFGREEEIILIPSPRDYRDIRQIDAEDIRWFKNRVRERGNGVCVVFDIGGTVSGDLDILREFDCVYLPYLSDSVSGRKVKHWDNLAGTQWKSTDMPTFQKIDMTNQNIREVAKDVLKGRLW